jgi:transposase
MPKSISSQKKWEILFLHQKEEGPRLSIAKTAKKLRIAKSTVTHWIRVFRETGEMEEKKSTGRPRKTSHIEDEEIINMMENDRALTSEDLSKEMKTRGVEISSSTIRRRLHEAGLQFSSPTLKPALETLHQTERLRFAKQNKRRNWNNVLFTDETTFNLKPRNRKIWKRRTEKIYMRRKRHYPKIHVWGCFGSKGFGQIVLFKENLTSKKLIKIYEEGLLPSTKMFNGTAWTLLEDNDSKHMSKVANSWKEKTQH